MVLNLSIKKARSQLLDERYKWDFWIPKEGDAGKERGGFSAILWRNEDVAIMQAWESQGLQPPLWSLGAKMCSRG